MFNQIHYNSVFYRDTPAPGNRHRQIVILESRQFEMRIFEGEVIKTEPEFSAESTDAEVCYHPTLIEAVADADKESRDSVQAGWKPYRG